MESIGYMLVYFMKGSLPWSGIKARKKEKRRMVWMKKMSTPIDALCDGLGSEFINFIQYCRNLDFQIKPEYKQW
jgi:hypothetical protein